jgi:hypothetical protein
MCAMLKVLRVLDVTHRRTHEPCPFPVELLGRVETTSSSVELSVEKNAVIVLHSEVSQYPQEIA